MQRIYKPVQQILPILLCFLIGCSPIYVSKLAYHQTRMLLAREDTDQLLKSPEVQPSVIKRLTLTKDVLEYAELIGLNTGKRYATFSQYDFPNLWVITASKKLSLKAHHWWFPIIGEVPYKGFFTLEDALAEAHELNRLGLDVSLRTASAFSSLGWFNDPLTQALFKLEEIDYVATIFHELFHSTIWINEEIALNESFAQAFGYWTAKNFYHQIKSPLESNTKERLERNYQFSKIIVKTKRQLETVFDSAIVDFEKVRIKKEIYSNLRFDLGLESNPNALLEQPFGSADNNAYFLSLAIYFQYFKEALEFLEKSEHPKLALDRFKELKRKNALNTLVDNTNFLTSKESIDFKKFDEEKGQLEMPSN